MTLLSFIFLLAAHYFAGRGLLSLFNMRLTTAKQITLSLITGVVIISLVPFVLELMHIPITYGSVLAGILVTVLLMSAKSLFALKRSSFVLPSLRIPSFRSYELPFMLLFALIMLASVWRAYYFPPTARDMLSGPEVIAEYAVKEHTMVNSVLGVNLETTNNHEKPPFVTGLQIIYKLSGFAFGQVWLAIIAVSFYIFLYHLLRERLHPLLACVLMLFFITIPEIYAYSYVMLFDYSNMVLFFLGGYFLFRHFDTTERKDIYFSAVLFGLATYIRLETLVLVGLLMPAYWLYALKTKVPLQRIVLPTITILAIPAIFYFLWINVFLKYYMPGNFTVGTQINTNFSDLKPLVIRFMEMNRQLIFGKYSQPLWGYFITMFIVVVLADLIFIRKVSRENRNFLYAIAVVYFGLPLLGYLIPLVDLLNTTKRGLFKMFPFMLIVLANSGLLQKASSALTSWENKLPEPVARPVVNRPAPRKVKAAKR
jgi:hypothetical protein